MHKSKHSPSSVPEDRDLTDRERELIRWMLEHGNVDATPFLEQLTRARVVSRCPCGCASIDLILADCAKPTGPLQVLADFLYGDVASLCGVFVFAQSGLLSGLEVSGFAVDPPRELPRTTELRPLAPT